MTQLLLLIGVAVLVAANGFFVAAEFALVRARGSKIDELAEEGKKGARLAAHQIDHIDEYLSACQLGITMASLGIGFMGEPAIASLIEKLLGESVPHGVSLAVSFGFAYFDHHGAAHHGRRAGAEDLRHHPRGVHGVAHGAAAGGLPGGVQAADLAAEHRLQRDAAGRSAPTPRPSSTRRPRPRT